MISLRSYQTAAIERARAAYKRGPGWKGLLFVSPTGSGKTVLLSEVVRSHLTVPGRRVSWYAHRRELLEQARTTLTDMGGCDAVTMCSVQGTLANLTVPDCTMAVFDEAHHFAADEWHRLIAAHREMGAIIVGATATPERGDGRGLGHVFDHMEVVALPSELVASGHLVDVDLIRPRKPLRAGTIAQRPVDAYLQHAPKGRAIVFAPHLVAATEYQRQFYAAGVACQMVHGAMSIESRAIALHGFKSGESRVVVNVMVLTEGFDAPVADTCILARGCGSAGAYLQMCGRVLRPYPGKTRATIIDLRGVSHELGSPLDDRTFSLEGQGISRPGVEVLGERMCEICQVPLDELGVCQSCGKSYALMAPTVVGEDLHRWDGKRRDDDAQRIAQLRRWMAKFPGKRDWFYCMRYSHVYGAMPPREWLERARR